MLELRVVHHHHTGHPHLSLLPPCGPGVAVLVSVVRLGALLTPCPGPALDTCNMGAGGGVTRGEGGPSSRGWVLNLIGTLEKVCTVLHCTALCSVDQALRCQALGRHAVSG